jgi:hypothetical protein
MSDEPITPSSKNLNPSNNARCGFATMIILCLLQFLCVVAFRAALERTPYELQDSQGRTMGFNDVFSREHYGFIYDRVSINGSISYLNAYDWFFIATLILGLWLLWKAQRKTLLIYSCAQLVLFPVGFFGILMGVFTMFDSLKSPSSGFIPHCDREFFIDIPFIPIAGHATWLLCAILMILAMWRGRRI